MEYTIQFNVDVQWWYNLVTSEWFCFSVYLAISFIIGRIFAYEVFKMEEKEQDVPPTVAGVCGFLFWPVLLIVIILPYVLFVAGFKNKEKKDGS